MADFSTLFRALADPTRLRIAQLARRMELTVGELVEVLAQSQPRVSRHVKILAEAGLLERHKEGSWVFVRFAGGRIADAVAALLDEAEDPAEDLQRLELLRTTRAAEAALYFDRHAENWDSIRQLHVPDSEVEGRIRDLLAGRHLGRLLDVGTGTGRMIEVLACDASESVGIDRSADMLRAARGKLDAAGIGNCSMRQGDMTDLPLEAGSFDTVVLHQVLHFAERPAAAIKEAARVLRPGGRLLIADFAPHEREELRRQHAHVRLGFEDEAVASWMRHARLTPRAPEHLPGGDLTMTIWMAENGPAPERKPA